MYQETSNKNSKDEDFLLALELMRCVSQNWSF